jgi:pyrimidine operon attenuation protein / uracil phosphoribosyltransferase
MGPLVYTPSATRFIISPRYATFIKIFRLKTILNEQQLAITIQRLSQQVLENHLELENTVLIGLQPRGIYFSDRIVGQLRSQVAPGRIAYGKLDITFYRDDVRRALHEPNRTEIPFSIENKNVILIDDVLWTGRTIRAALDALLDFGRPSKVELCVLIDRRLSRQLPIQADYTGKSIDSMITQKVKVYWSEKDGKDEVELL